MIAATLMRLFASIIALLLPLAESLALGQAATSLPTTFPATRPATTRAATQPADLSSPRATLRALAAALRDGDPVALRRVIWPANAAEERMIDAMADMAAALAGLHRAALAAYGPESAARFTTDTAAHFEQTLARIEAATVTIENDRAAVQYAGEDRKYVLRRDGAGWRIPMSELSRGADAATIEQRLAELKVQVQIVRDLEEEIAAGRHGSPDVAIEAWRTRITRTVARTQPSGE